MKRDVEYPLHIDLGNGYPCCDTPERWRKVLIPRRWKGKEIPMKKLSDITAADEGILCKGCLYSIFTWSAKNFFKNRHARSNEWIGVKTTEPEVK